MLTDDHTRFKGLYTETQDLVRNTFESRVHTKAATKCFFASIGRRLKEVFAHCKPFLTVGPPVATANEILTLGI